MRSLPALCALVGCGRSLPPGDPVTPDLVLVSIDTLRADHLSGYGHDRPTSPFLDRLAASGLRWSHARSPSPWTLPAHATLLSGWLPARHGAVEDDLGLPAEAPLLAEALAARGFATGGFTSTLYVSRKYGFERGFEEFDDFGIDTTRENLSGEVTAREVVDRALAWLRGLPPGQPAFLFVHLYDVHYAYDPPVPYDTLFDRAPRRGDPRYRSYAWYLEHPPGDAALAHQAAQYDEAIRFVDDEIARLHMAFAEAGRAATWVVTSDHGEEFGERGAWGHAHTLFPEQLHVPLIVAGARVTGPGVVDEVVGLQDLAPGLAALTGATLPAADGLPLSLAGSTGPAEGRAFLADTSRFATNRLGLWRDGWRLDLDLAGEVRRLYDTRADPSERQDLSTAEPARADLLQSLLLGALGAPWTCREPCALDARHGRIAAGGAVLGVQADLPAGARFQLVPVDAEVRLRGSADWYRAGPRPPPAGGVLAWEGTSGGGVTLAPDERARLEALGYVQGE